MIHSTLLLPNPLCQLFKKANTEDKIEDCLNAKTVDWKSRFKQNWRYILKLTIQQLKKLEEPLGTITILQ